MAEGNSGKSLEELNREITCSICQEHYTEPKILPCLHYFCKECITELSLRAGAGKPFTCPECRCDTTLPEGGVMELKAAFFVNRLIATVSTMEKTFGKVEVRCELCEGSSGIAEAFCRQCARFICQECVDLHKRIAVFKTHDVASLDDLKHGRAKPIIMKEPPKEKCSFHEKSLKIYCYGCECLICRDCTVKDHRDHNFEFTKKAAPDEKTKLLEELKPLKDQHAKLISAVEQIQNVKLDVNSQKMSTLDQIKSSFKMLRDILDRHEDELMKEAETISQDKVEKLSVQEKTLNLASVELQSVIDYTEQSLRHSTDSEVMGMLSEVRKKIEHKMGEHSKSKKLEPEEVADMGVEVKCADALLELCRTKASIVKRIDLTKCTVQMDKAAEVGKASKATLITKLNNNDLAKRDCNVTCHLKSLHSGVLRDADVKDDGSGRYSIHYTPTVRGRHELAILIDELHVAGSPFPVFVSVHPTQLGKPVKVWSGLSEPIGISVNSEGDILVAEQSGSIVRFKPNGKKEKIVVQTMLKRIRNIAVDNEDNIYCIDFNNNKILSCDKNGGDIQIREVKPEKGFGRSGLCIKNNELLVSETYNNNTIVVYDRNLKCVRIIQHKNIGMVTDISTDALGNIYVTDLNSICIEVFSSDGTFLRSLCQDKTKLSHPWGVCVSGQYMYVTDDKRHCVSVFTTDGKFVTSFGQRGAREGEFKDPYYLCVDQDGFVYVCDLSNNRVQCF